MFMADARLVGYLREHLKNYPADQLLAALRAQGWPEPEIQDALATVTGTGIPRQQPEVPPPAAGQPPGLLERTVEALFHPGRLFAGVKTQRIGGAFVSLFLAVVIGTMLTTLVQLVFPQRSFIQSLAFGFVSYVPFAESAMINVTGLVLAMAFSFIAAGFLHLFVIVFGGKGGYRDSYKAVAYSWTPALLFGFLGVPLGAVVAGGETALIVFLLWGLWILIKGLSALHEFSAGRAILILIMPVVALIVIAVILALFFAELFFTIFFFFFGGVL